MTDKKEWQEANRELIAEERRKLGDPPTAEEMAAFHRGELSESEEERIRDLLVAYPELARMYSEPAPDAPQPGDADYVAEEQVAASWRELRQRLPRASESPMAVRDEAQRGRVLVQHHIPTAIAAAIALLFIGLYVHAESRARYYAQQGLLPRVLGEPQELEADPNRGADEPTPLRKDGEAYLLKPAIINQPRYAHYQLELRDTKDALLWANRNAQPDLVGAFQIVIPHAFLRDGEQYRLLVFAVDGKALKEVASFDLSVPVE